MTTSTNDELLQQAQQCFFAAMMQGWAAGTKAVPVPDMPGHKQIVYEDGKFRVIDRFGVSNSGRSAGTTTIWFSDEPIWFMSYGGFYRKEDIPFLKRALMQDYGEWNFHGGRGPDSIREGVLHYINHVDVGSRFSRFQGKEVIYDGNETVGYHNYLGMTLI